MSAASLSSRYGKRGADGVERALHVHVDHLLELVGRQVEERAVRADPGVGHEDVDAAEALGRRGGQRLEVSWAADVARGGDGSFDAEVVSAPRCEAEMSAVRGERARDRRADAAARACDESNLPFERDHSSSRGRRAGYRERKRR